MRWWQDNENQEKSLNGAQQDGWLTGEGMTGNNTVGPEPWEKIEEGINKYYDNLIAKGVNQYSAWEKYKLKRQRNEAIEEAYDRYVYFWGRRFGQS